MAKIRQQERFTERPEWFVIDRLALNLGVDQWDQIRLCLRSLSLSVVRLRRSKRAASA